MVRWNPLLCPIWGFRLPGHLLPQRAARVLRGQVLRSGAGAGHKVHLLRPVRRPRIHLDRCQLTLTPPDPPTSNRFSLASAATVRPAWAAQGPLVPDALVLIGILSALLCPIWGFKLGPKPSSGSRPRSAARWRSTSTSSTCSDPAQHRPTGERKPPALLG